MPYLYIIYVLFLQENIYTTLKFCRWLSFFVALFLLIKAGYQYQDYNKINFDTLHEIEKNVKNISMAVTELRQQFLQGGRYFIISADFYCVYNIVCLSIFLLFWPF